MCGPSYANPEISRPAASPLGTSCPDSGSSRVFFQHIIPRVVPRASLWERLPLPAARLRQFGCMASWRAESPLHARHAALSHNAWGLGVPALQARRGGEGPMGPHAQRRPEVPDRPAHDVPRRDGLGRIIIRTLGSSPTSRIPILPLRRHAAKSPDKKRLKTRQEAITKYGDFMPRVGPKRPRGAVKNGRTPGPAQKRQAGGGASWRNEECSESGPGDRAGRRKERSSTPSGTPASTTACRTSARSRKNGVTP